MPIDAIIFWVFVSKNGFYFILFFRFYFILFFLEVFLGKFYI